jgi:aspartate/methionine/tyrosine aminotransferase
MTLERPSNTHLISSRSRGVRISAIKEMALLSADVEDAASLAWGLPSFPTPEPIRRAVEERLENDPEIGMYTLPGGGMSQLCFAAEREHLRATANGL